MKPLIGVNLDQDAKGFSLLRPYWDAISEAGGVAVALPPIFSLSDLDEVLETVDGLLLTGGGDIDPARYGERPHPSLKPVLQPKHDSDFQLAARAFEFGIPTLAVCYGMQLAAVIHGAKLVQDIGSSVRGALDHWGAPDRDAEHPVRLEAGSRVREILGSDTLMINSHHHQSVADAGSMKVTARAEDGVVEAVELPGAERFFLGVQWHPERMKNRPDQLALYRALVDEAARYRDGSGFDVTFVPQRG